MPATPRLRFDYWWEALPALPPSRATIAYRRLARVFRDQTRPTKVDPLTGKPGQEFTDPSRETHLTVAMWENFVIYPVRSWVPRLWVSAGLETRIGPVRRCNWSYEWAEHGKPGARHCDLVMEYEDSYGRGILVVEAKRPGKSLSDKDLDPGYYLGIQELSAFSRRSIIYLIDESARKRDEERIQRGRHDVGFLGWTQLADIQLDLVETLEAPAEVRAFVAASLYRTYVERGIVPTHLPLAYLASEPSAAEVVNKNAGACLGKADWCRKIWRLPAED